MKKSGYLPRLSRDEECGVRARREQPVWQQGLQRLGKQKWNKYTINFTEHAVIEAQSGQAKSTHLDMNQSGV